MEGFNGEYYSVTFHLLEYVGNSRRQSWKELKQLHKKKKKQLGNAEEIMSPEQETKERHRNQKRIKKEKRRYPELNTSVHNNGN